jgi:peptide/nickel transport system permease protein
MEAHAALEPTTAPGAVLEAAVPASKPRRELQLIVGCTIVAVFVLMAIFAPLLAPHDPNDGDILNRLTSPNASHPLGTDAAGRDVLSRLLYATRVDLPFGVLLAFLPMVIGTLLGSLAGYAGRMTDIVVMRTAELIQAFPFYVLILALVAVLEPGMRAILLVFLLIGWVPYASLARAELLRVREQEYIQAAIVVGLPRWRILLRHALPNSIDATLAYFPADVLFAIVSLAGLSFLGVGIQDPTAEWGSMISAGQPYVLTNWWLVVAPGAMLVTLGVGLILIGDVLSQRLRER